ncbi:MAG: LytTR family DNA-binding domain-containing protein [Proteobacteria bacterium]|nr:LytTR family DNA-binding domain-containing protein [Pseudomonadota bacterium]
MIECIILEDEKPAQKILQSYIQNTPFLSLLGIFESGVHIPHALITKTDLLFLDVQLPKMSGLSYLKTLGNPPKVIVTTAHTLEAFEEAVVDYLLKPFSYERFFKAIDRARNTINTNDQKNSDKIFVYSDKTFYNLYIKDILFIKAEVDYVDIITESKNYLILDSLKNWNEKLKSHNFVQAHRSYIVNLDKVNKIQENKIYFDNNRKVSIGTTFKKDLLLSVKN